MRCNKALWELKEEGREKKTYGCEVKGGVTYSYNYRLSIVKWKVNNIVKMHANSHYSQHFSPILDIYTIQQFVFVFFYCCLVAWHRTKGVSLFHSSDIQVSLGRVYRMTVFLPSNLLLLVQMKCNLSHTN